VRTLGKRVKGNLSGVQIPYPPPEKSVLSFTCSNRVWQYQ